MSKKCLCPVCVMSIPVQPADTTPPPYLDGDMTHTAHEHFLLT